MDYLARRARPATARRPTARNPRMLLDDYLHIAHRIDRGMAERYCPRLTGEVLDVGCGRRPYRAYLTGASRYVGLDPNPDVEPDVVASVLELPFRPPRSTAASATRYWSTCPSRA